MSLSVSARNAYKASDAGVVVHPEGWSLKCNGLSGESLKYRGIL